MDPFGVAEVAKSLRSSPDGLRSRDLQLSFSRKGKSFVMDTSNFVNAFPKELLAFRLISLAGLHRFTLQLSLAARLLLHL